MTNKEKYGNEIIELAANTALFGLKVTSWSAYRSSDISTWGMAKLAESEDV